MMMMIHSSQPHPLSLFRLSLMLDKLAFYMSERGIVNLGHEEWEWPMGCEGDEEGGEGQCVESGGGEGCIEAQ